MGIKWSTTAVKGPSLFRNTHKKLIFHLNILYDILIDWKLFEYLNNYTYVIHYVWHDHSHLHQYNI